MAFEEERLSSSGRAPRWVLEEHRARYRFAAQRVKGKVVVDCSCGTGLGTQQYISERPAGLVAIDLDRRAVVEASKTTAGRSDIQFVCADALKLPIASSSIELFVSLETIEHLSDYQAFLDEVGRVLMPAGTLIVSTPNRTVT